VARQTTVLLIRVSKVLPSSFPSSLPHHCAGSVPEPAPQPDVLSQEVTGEWGILTIHKGCGCEGPALSAGRQGYLKLFRTYVSRKAAGKVKAVLEGVDFDTDTISACFTAHPLNDEEAVQEGLTRWCGGKGRQPPTWAVLVEAMQYAQIDQQTVQGLKEELGRQCMNSVA